MAVVTISRLQGAGGDEIARGVAERLGYNVVDTGLIARVAERAGVSVDKVRDYDEKSQSRAVEWLKTVINPRMGKILASDVEQIDPKSFVEYAKTVIRGLAEEDNMVIVGRASQFILRDIETAYHVRIIADNAFRTERIMARRGCFEAEARDILRKSDIMRRNYIERYFGTDWDDLFAYHLVIDSGKNGLDETTLIIAGAVSRFSITHDFIPGVRDRRKTSRRADPDRRKHERRAEVASWSHRDLEHAVMRGRPVRTSATPDRRQTRRRSGQDRRSQADG